MAPAFLGVRPAGTALEEVPIFTVGPGTSTGLELLAAAAAAKASTSTASITDVVTTTGARTLSRPVTSLGPYNPAAAIPAEVANKIIELEFVEMSEVTLDDDLPQTPGHTPAPACLPITDIS